VTFSLPVFYLKIGDIKISGDSCDRARAVSPGGVGGGEVRAGAPAGDVRARGAGRTAGQDRAPEGGRGQPAQDLRRPRVSTTGGMG